MLDDAAAEALAGVFDLGNGFRMEIDKAFACLYVPDSKAMLGAGPEGHCVWYGEPHEGYEVVERWTGEHYER